MGAEQAQVTMLAVESIKPYENNASTHSDEQINKFRKSLREFGFVNPVLINEDNTLIAANAVERKCYMMELDPKYVETICRRWEQLTGGKRTKV